MILVVPLAVPLRAFEREASLERRSSKLSGWTRYFELPLFLLIFFFLLLFSLGLIQSVHRLVGSTPLLGQLQYTD